MGDDKPKDEPGTHGYLQGRTIKGPYRLKGLRLHIVPSSVATFSAAIDAVAGVNTGELVEMLTQLGRHDLEALKDGTLDPADLGLPKPPKVTEDAFPALVASLVRGELDDRVRREERSRWRLQHLVLPALAFLVGLLMNWNG
ncbi:hypothetical protein [Lentisalinibacter salinarum]|uniref:hypothetical protein n=1 Tax=Lentisalinibacter salinarum TaxID=2992239 RepID=UPI00386725C9